MIEFFNKIKHELQVCDVSHSLKPTQVTARTTRHQILAISVIWINLSNCLDSSFRNPLSHCSSQRINNQATSVMLQNYHISGLFASHGQQNVAHALSLALLFYWWLRNVGIGSSARKQQLHPKVRQPYPRCRSVLQAPASNPAVLARHPLISCQPRDILESVS